MYKNINVRRPYFCVNPKSYIYGKETLELAKGCDELAVKYDVDIFYTGQLIDLPAIIANCPHLIPMAQKMDPIVPGRGMGAVLPNALAEAGVKAVFFNHAECPLTLRELSRGIEIADSLGLISMVATNSLADTKAVAEMAPNIIVPEQDNLIGTGITADDDYVNATTKAILDINPEIWICQGAGIKNGDDVYRMIMAGSAGSGGTSQIMNAPDRVAKVEDMLQGLVRARNELNKLKI